MVKNGKTLLSGIDPVRRAEKTADSVSLNDRTLFLCPSPLYGYGLARLLSRLEKDARGCAVLCIEADSELFELTGKNIDEDLLKNKNFHITNICDPVKLCSLVNSLWGTLSFRRIETIRFTGGYQLFPDLYSSLYETLRRQFASDWSNALTLTKLGRLYIRNCMRNLSLAQVFPSVSELSFNEDTVLVLGAGPSLDETLDFLVRSKVLGASSEELGVKNRGRKFRIICVDTCLGALRDRGIVPDLAVILESQHWNIRDFIGSAGVEIPAAVDLSSLPASAKILNGDGFLFFTPWTHLRIFERLKDAGLLPAAVSPLGSVGLTAVEIAKRVTRGKIICTGLDFSFTADSYHARGTPGHLGKLNKQNRFSRLFNNAVFEESTITVLSKEGKNSYTNPIMKNYRNLFEQEFGNDPRIYDIKGNGLPLGVKTISLDELKKEFNHEPARTSTNPCCDAEQQVCVRTEGSINVVRGKELELSVFYENERKRLEELRGILTGEAEMNEDRLTVLLNECDYIWAHFPDCAGGRKTDLKDVAFLKRVRTEIDPMLKILINKNLR